MSRTPAGAPLVPWMNRVAFAYLGAGLTAVAVYYLIPSDSTAQGVVYDLVGASAAAATVAGGFQNRRYARAPWVLSAAGLASFTAGDVIFNVYADVLHETPPIPSAADVFYLGGYPLLTLGLALMIRRVGGWRRRAGLTDAAIVTAVFTLAQWLTVMAPVLGRREAVAAKAVELAYPAGDVLLLGALAAFFLTPAWRTVSYRYLVASVALLLVADELYSLSPGRYVSASWLDSFWLLSYVAWGVAALHPSMRALARRTRSNPPRIGAPRLVVLAAALAMPPAALLVERLHGGPVDAIAISIGGVVLSLLVLGRMASVAGVLEGLRAAEREARGEAEEARRRLAEQNEQLLAADRLKDEFVAMVSHDLRTPLTSILGFVDLVLDDEEPASSEHREYLAIAQRNAQRLQHLVDDLLFAARLQAGRLDLAPQQLDLGEVADAAVADARLRADDAGIRLELRVRDRVVVEADRGRMFQLLDNLLTNALKFTPEGGVVTVAAAAGADGACLEVSDSGIGIPADEREHVFDRFFRTSRSAERELPGTGLGLHISRAIVEAHGGSIECRSNEGGGTVFTVELPLVASGAPLQAVGR